MLKYRAFLHLNRGKLLWQNVRHTEDVEQAEEPGWEPVGTGMAEAMDVEQEEASDGGFNYLPGLILSL